MHGRHSSVHWSRTQQLVALSSAEAELNAGIKAAQEALGLTQMALEVEDSSAADGIIKRAGSGRVKHLTVRQLWLQEQNALGTAFHEKIPTAENPADALTHFFTKSEA